MVNLVLDIVRLEGDAATAVVNSLCVWAQASVLAA
jgi:hypothetical protein